MIDGAEMEEMEIPLAEPAPEEERHPLEEDRQRPKRLRQPPAYLNDYIRS